MCLFWLPLNACFLLGLWVGSETPPRQSGLQKNSCGWRVFHSWLSCWSLTTCTAYHRRADGAWSQTRVRGAEGAGGFDLVETGMCVCTNKINDSIIRQWFYTPLRPPNTASTCSRKHTQTYTHTHVVCAHKHPNRVGFRDKATQTLWKAVRRLNGPFSPTSP